MGIPLAWHRRHALLLASQLPDNPADAKMIVQALNELMDTFIAAAPPEEAQRPSNVLPFAAG